MQANVKGAGERAAGRPATGAAAADAASTAADDGVPAGAGARHAPPARGRLGDPLTPLELGAWRGMLRAHAVLTRRLDAELRARHGLSLTAYEALMLIADAPRGRMRVSELSGATLLSVSGVSRLVDRLAREGLVAKEACPEDGRGSEVTLTPMGRGRLRAARASHLADVRECFLSRLSDDELTRLADIWDRVAPEGPAPA